MTIGTESARVIITLPKYASPPRDFIVDADVQALWSRYEGYLGNVRLTG